MYYIHWKSKLTGYKGKDQKPLPRNIAEAWIADTIQTCTYWLVAV